MHSINDQLIIGDETSVNVFNALSDNYQLVFDGTVNDITVDGETYWTVNGAKGLNGYQYEMESSEVVSLATEIIPNSPIRNYCEFMKIHKTKNRKENRL